LTSEKLISTPDREKTPFCTRGDSPMPLLPFRYYGEDDEEPYVQDKHLYKLKDDLGHDVLSQKYTAIDYDQRKLQDKHEKKQNRYSVIFQIRGHSTVALLCPERTVTYQDDEKVVKIAEEHVGVDVGGDSRSRIAQLLEEPLETFPVLEQPKITRFTHSSANIAPLLTPSSTTGASATSDRPIDSSR
jgi:hypothetical protein